MANNFDSNFTRKLMESFLDSFESSRTLSKNVNTQLMSGKFTPNTGDNIDVKRPTDYVSVRTAGGDLTSATASSIITGKATATVQPYFTSYVDFNEADEALKMGQIDELLRPLATRIKTDFELDFAAFMMKNSGLYSGDVGTGITTWDEVANCGALMRSTGVPEDNDWCMAVNPFTEKKLASVQRSIGTADPLVSPAFQNATIANSFAGMRVMSATTLGSYSTFSSSDRAGTLSGAPTPTYVAAKDTMTQTLAVTAFGANTVVAAGEVVQVVAAAGAINRLNLSTRQPIIDENGAAILWTGTVTTGVTLGASGEGNLEVTGPAIFEAAGQYNTVSQVIASGDVINLLGANSSTFQPNLFWHKDAFTVASVPIKKLQSVDTVGTTEDGLQFRCSKGSDWTKNSQQVRFDFRPAYGVLNPFFAGQAYGDA